MLYEAKVRKVGSSQGIILSKELLEQLGVSEGDKLHFIKEPGGDLKVTAYDPDFDHQMAVALRGMDRYKNALRELADK